MSESQSPLGRIWPPPPETAEDAELTIPVRLLLLLLGVGFHVAGRTYLRYISG